MDTCKFTHYTVGFLTNKNREIFLMVKKGTGDNIPEPVRGKWNGIGGKTDSGESAQDGMVREFFEETLHNTETKDWKHFLSYTGSDSDPFPHVINFFVYERTIHDMVYPITNDVGEKLAFISTRTIDWEKDCVHNLPWILAYLKNWDGKTILEYTTYEE